MVKRSLVPPAALAAAYLLRGLGFRPESDIARAVRLIWAQQRGATAVEYGLLVAAIAAAIVGVVFLIGPEIAAVFESISNKLATRM